MISTTTLFLFSILFFRFEDTAELTHNCILYKVCFYDIYLTYEVVTLNLEFNWFDRSQTLLFAFSIFVVETVTIFGDIL